VRALFATAPGVGHLRPALPYLSAFTDRGHTVAVAASATVARQVLPDGIMLYQKPPDSYPRQLPPDQDWDSCSQGMARLSYTGVRQAAEDFRPDVIIHDFSERGGYLAAEALGLPHATLSVSADTVCASYLSREIGMLAPLRAELGLPADPAGATIAPLCLNIMHPAFYGSLPLQPTARFYGIRWPAGRRPAGRGGRLDGRRSSWSASARRSGSTAQTCSVR
jgi:N-glycosyltransferase